MTTTENVNNAGGKTKFASKKVADPTKTNQTTYGAIEKLATERKIWQDGAFHTSNEQLYQILKGCYELYMKMCGIKADSAHLRDTLIKYIAENNITVKNNAHTMTKIVRCVFGNDRRRVSAYSIVLRAALAANIKTEKLLDYIRANGGVEEVRLGKSANYVSPKTKAEVATSWMRTINLGVVKSDELSKRLDAARVGCQHVLVVTQQADGSLIANAFVSSTTAVTTALGSVYAELKEQKKTAQAERATTDATSGLNTAIAQAAEQVMPQAA